MASAPTGEFILIAFCLIDSTVTVWICDSHIIIAGGLSDADLAKVREELSESVMEKMRPFMRAVNSLCSSLKGWAW